MLLYIHHQLLQLNEVKKIIVKICRTFLSSLPHLQTMEYILTTWSDWVCALVRDIVSCSCTRHLTLAVPLSTQVYKWVK